MTIILLCVFMLVFDIANAIIFFLLGKYIHSSFFVIYAVITIPIVYLKILDVKAKNSIGKINRLLENEKNAKQTIPIH